MYYKGLLKRIVPFFLTFAAGLFIASFFVTIARPSFNGFRRGSNKHREIQRLMRLKGKSTHDVIREGLGEFFYKETNRRPVVLPSIVKVV